MLRFLIDIVMPALSGGKNIGPAIIPAKLSEVEASASL